MGMTIGAPPGIAGGAHAVWASRSHVHEIKAPAATQRVQLSIYHSNAVLATGKANQQDNFFVSFRKTLPSQRARTLELGAGRKGSKARGSLVKPGPSAILSEKPATTLRTRPDQSDLQGRQPAILLASTLHRAEPGPIARSRRATRCSARLPVMATSSSTTRAQRRPAWERSARRPPGYKEDTNLAFLPAFVT
jgi:hypothetical protein